MIKNWLLMIVVMLGLQSCVTTEELHVKNNGENTFSVDVNFSGLLDMIPEKEKLLNESKQVTNVINGEELSVEQLLDILVMKEKNPEQKKDSILRANPTLLKDTENLRFKTTLTEEIGDLEFIVRTKNISELNKSLKHLKQLNNEITKNTKDDKFLSQGKIPNFFSDSKFEMNKKVFHRKVDASTENEESSGSLFNEMGDMFKYKLKVNFEKPIAKVSYPDAVISEDKKSFVKEFSLMKVVKNPKLLEYTVEFQ